MPKDNPTATLRNIPALRKIGYGVGNISYSLAYQAFATFFIFYATAILKLPPALAGVMMAVSAAWDAITDPLMGFISDNTESQKFGRRHQYILIGALSISLFSYLLWTVNPGWETMLKFWILLSVVIIFRTALTIFVAPYNALGAELSTDYDERSSIQGYRAQFYILGMILAIAGSTMVFFRSTPEFARGQLNPAAYPKMGTAIGVIVLLTAAISYFTTKRYIPLLPQRSEEMRREKANLRRLYTDLWHSLQNHDFLMVGLMIFIIEVGFQLGIAIGIHVNTYCYQLTGPQMGILGLTVLGFSILSQPFWVWFTKKFDKKQAVITGMIVGLIGFVGAPWSHIWWKVFPLQPETIVYSLGIFNILAGIGNGAFMSIPYSMVADTADAEEVRTGKRDEGLYFGMYTFAYKLGTSISIFSSGFLLSWIRFNPDLTEQTPHTIFNLAMMPTYFLLIISPLALYFISKYRITRERYREIQAILQERQGD